MVSFPIVNDSVLTLPVTMGAQIIIPFPSSEKRFMLNEWVFTNKCQANDDYNVIITIFHDLSNETFNYLQFKLCKEVNIMVIAQIKCIHSFFRNLF